jgi:hypothetical protein
MNILNNRRANKYHSEAQKLHDNGDNDAALVKYLEALKWHEGRASTHYNIGPIHKYRNNWLESFKHNKRAVELRPDDEASNWNLAIAATALRDWKTARAVWASLKMNVELGDAEIADNFGMTPVRLSPNGDAEVVWARRIDPVRARITNIPFPESGYRYGDIVLHDGAAVGYRLDANKNEKPVFNVMELFTPSEYSTYMATLEVTAPSDIESLEALCDEAEVPFEDWTGNTKNLCKECSEGRPYESHDHEEPEKWQGQRKAAFALTDEESAKTLLAKWTNEHRRCDKLALTLPSPK